MCLLDLIFRVYYYRLTEPIFLIFRIQRVTCNFIHYTKSFYFSCDKKNLELLFQIQKASLVIMIYETNKDDHIHK